MLKRALLFYCLVLLISTFNYSHATTANGLLTKFGTLLLTLTDIFRTDIILQALNANPPPDPLTIPQIALGSSESLEPFLQTREPALITLVCQYQPIRWRHPSTIIYCI